MASDMSNSHEQGIENCPPAATDNLQSITDLGVPCGRPVIHHKSTIWGPKNGFFGSCQIKPVSARGKFLCGGQEHICKKMENLRPFCLLVPPHFLGLHECGYLTHIQRQTPKVTKAYQTRTVFEDAGFFSLRTVF